MCTTIGKITDDIHKALHTTDHAHYHTSLNIIYITHMYTMYCHSEFGAEGTIGHANHALGAEL